MLFKAGVVLLVAAVLRVSATPSYIDPDFIENVNKIEPSSPNRIVSGWAATPGQHPHQANLRMVDATGSVSACGGSFVARNWMITAAHCTASRVTLVIRGGATDISTPEYISETTEWWNYPTFDNSRPTTVQPDDISIVRLQAPLTYTRNVKAIRIQSRADAFNSYEGERVITSGYGRIWTNGALSDVLRWVYLRGIADTECLRIFGHTVVTANTICAQWYNVTSQSPCQGDSGGPLVHVGADGVETLIGVTSFVAGGELGCHSGYPAGYIRPGPFQDWFEDISGIDFDNLDEEEDESATTPPPGGEDNESSPTPPPGGEDDDSTSRPPPGGEDEDGEDDGSDDGSGDSSEIDDSDDSSESSESDEDDDETSQLMKHLQVKVKVKVSLNKYIKGKKKAIKDKKKLTHHKTH